MATLRTRSPAGEGRKHSINPSECSLIIMFTLTLGTILAVVTLIITGDPHAVAIVVPVVLAPAAWALGRSSSSQQTGGNERGDA